MSRSPAELSDADLAFLAERHLATLTTVRADGSPHVVAIAFGYDSKSAVARVICSDGGQKVRNVESNDRAVLCQVEGRRWLALEGRAIVTRDVDRVSLAVASFEARYRPVQPNSNRVAIEVMVDRVLGQA